MYREKTFFISKTLTLSQEHLFMCRIWMLCQVKNKDVAGAVTGDPPTTSEWSTILLPTKLRPILEVWGYIKCAAHLPGSNGLLPLVHDYGPTLQLLMSQYMTQWSLIMLLNQLWFKTHNWAWLGLKINPQKGLFTEPVSEKIIIILMVVYMAISIEYTHMKPLTHISWN